MQLIISPPQSPPGIMDRMARIHHWIAFLFLIREYNESFPLVTLYQRGILSKVPKHSAYNIKSISACAQKIRKHETKSHAPLMIQLESSTEPVFRVLVSRRQVIHRDSTTLVYRVKFFLRLPLNPLVTLSSSHFTRGKIANECDVTFELYRMQHHQQLTWDSCT